MGKYNTTYSGERGSSRRETEIHPVWRGVGFVFMILIPVMSYSAAMVLIEQNSKNGWLPMPVDLLARTGSFLYFGDPLIYIKGLLTLTFLFVFYAIFSFITFSINSAFGSTRYGPYDLPPVKRARRRR